MNRRLARFFMLAAAPVTLCACSGSPAALGITGPNGGQGAAVPGTPTSGDDSAIQAPGDPTDFGQRYSPSFAPTYGSDGRFYGYN